MNKETIERIAEKRASKIYFCKGLENLKQNCINDFTAGAEYVLPEIAKRDELIRELVSVLEQSDLQIEYLHRKFKPTGTGNSVLSRIRTAVAKAETILKGEL